LHVEGDRAIFIGFVIIFQRPVIETLKFFNQSLNGPWRDFLAPFSNLFDTPNANVNHSSIGVYSRRVRSAIS